MTTATINLTATQIDALSQTNLSPAMQVVTYDTIIRNGGAAPRKLITSELFRRLINPLNKYLRIQHYSDGQLSGLCTTMSGTKNWIDCSGDGVWRFNEGMDEVFLSHLEGVTYFGFDNADYLLDLLDQVTEPYDPQNPPSMVTKPTKVVAEQDQTVAVEDPKLDLVGKSSSEALAEVNKPALSERAAESERLVQQAIADRDRQQALEEEDPTIEDMRRQIEALEARIRNVTIQPYINRSGMLQDHIDDLFDEHNERMKGATTTETAEQFSKGLRHAIIQLVTDDLNSSIDEWVDADK